MSDVTLILVQPLRNERLAHHALVNAPDSAISQLDITMLWSCIYQLQMKYLPKIIP